MPLSTAAVIEYLTGVVIPADSIRDWCYGEGHKGYTFPLDMARYLWETRGIPAEVIVIDAPQDVINDALAKGWPVMARTWERSVGSNGYFHWTPVTSVQDSDWITRHQTLGGYQESIARPEWLRRYAGWLLVVKQARG